MEIKKFYRRDDNYFEDLTGRIFGRRIVRWAVGRHRNRVFWLCTCECGKMSVVDGPNLRNGGSSSCISCSLRARERKNAGLRYDPAYRMWQSAKSRAKRLKISFNIVLGDVQVPKMCPLLNIPLISGLGKKLVMSPNSPTLDRKIPSLGYVKENVWVISNKANLIKNDASIEEIKLLIKNWERFL